jgi:hypothetical protein
MDWVSRSFISPDSTRISAARSRQCLASFKAWRAMMELEGAKTHFKDLAPAYISQALKSKQVSALLVVEKTTNKTSGVGG